MRILIAEDDASIADGLQHSLRRAGHAVDWARNGREADAALVCEEFDLLILDLSLPKLSGFEVLRRLRGRDSRLPVLVLTGLDSVLDRVRGLDAGADDYLVKPFELAELEARARALTRRPMSGASRRIMHGRLSFDRVGRVAELDGARLELSARELALLELLLQRPGQLVHKQQLVHHLCEWGEEVSWNAIEVYVHRLRKKLAPGGVCISTVRGVGYCLEMPANPKVGH
jgi:two-component system OmpR family response regulator